jgi:sarcosine oxidase delta subunit
MSYVLDCMKCPQCGYEEADSEFNCRTSEQSVRCRKCGYSESTDAKWEGESLVGYTHQVTQGAGALFYRWKGAIGYTAYFLATKQEATDADKWLRERLACGEVRPSSAYVSRWDGEVSAVEFLVGKFFEPGTYDPDDEMPEQMGSSDLRPFQLAAKRLQVKLSYTCGHVLDGWILLLEGQPEPQSETVFDTHLPCRGCIPQFTKTGEADATQEPPRRRLWENRTFDGRSKSVTPAFNHPQTLDEATSRFYTAYPERKQYHPDSMGFRLQLEGWPDEEIAEKKWLCDCAGCRATPMSLGCIESKQQ